jgi:hypothetical protein
LGLGEEARHLAAVERLLEDFALGEQLETARVEFALKLGEKVQRFRGKNFSVFGGYWTEHLQACRQFDSVHSVPL